MNYLLLALERYLKGKNAEERTVASGKPGGAISGLDLLEEYVVCQSLKSKLHTCLTVVVIIEPLEASYTKAGDNFTIAFYLSENDEKTAPKPDNDNVLGLYHATIMPCNSS